MKKIIETKKEIRKESSEGYYNLIGGLPESAKDEIRDIVSRLNKKYQWDIGIAVYMAWQVLEDVNFHAATRALDVALNKEFG